MPSIFKKTITKYKQLSTFNSTVQQANK